ncbi:MAG TPA: MarR family transcriptional regulator [Allosphingosinicella sp.]|nr:MarR family transcriptional regulator [Allosphingosinicella sp.]
MSRPRAKPRPAPGGGAPAKSRARRPENAADPPCVAAARRLYDFRRRRDSLFPAYLFGEPVWDLLLELHIARHEGRRLSVTQACQAAIVPLTTGVRWIKELEARKLVLKEADEGDARRSCLRLTDAAVGKLQRLFDGMPPPTG